MLHVLFLLLVLLAIVFLGLILLAASKTELQQAFAKGNVSGQLPNGFYQGTTHGLPQGPWKGKKFDAATQMGINLFGDTEKYPFRWYKTKSLSGDQEVIKLDYAQPGNAFWLKMITDEIVEISPGKYLGKVYVSLLPGMPLLMGYFQLS